MACKVSVLLVKIIDHSMESFYKKDNNHKYDGGFNIYVSSDICVEPQQTKLLPTGISTALQDPNTTYYMMAPRSSIYKTPLIMQNSIGIIDAGYRGELKVPIFNLSNEPYMIKKGTSLTQLLHALAHKWEHRLVDVLPDIVEDNRNESGFGSTDDLVEVSINLK